MVKLFLALFFFFSSIQSSNAFWGTLIGVDVGLNILNAVINGGNGTSSKNQKTVDTKLVYCKSHTNGIVFKAYSKNNTCTKGSSLSTKSEYDKQTVLNSYNSGQSCRWDIMKNKTVCSTTKTKPVVTKKVNNNEGCAWNIMENKVTCPKNSSNKVTQQKSNTSVNDYYMAPYFKFVSVDNLLMRSSPNGKVLKSYPLNTKMGVYTSYKNEGGFKWVKVADISGNIGWMASEFLSNNQTIDNKTPDNDCKNVFNNSNECDKSKNNTIVQKKSNTTTNGTPKKEIDINQILNENSLERDFIAPTIELTQDIFTTNSETVTLTGSIKDESSIKGLIVAGQIFDIDEDGYFQAQIYIPIGKNSIPIIAVDAWDNYSDTIVKVERTFDKQSLIANNSVKPLNPIKIKTTTQSNKVAIIIGVRDYKDIPDTKFSDNDASYFMDYSTNTLGVPKANIKTFINDSASTFDLYDLDIWLQNKIKKNTDVYVFYSGHGITIDNKSYLLPYDFRTSQIERSAFEKQDFLNSILKYEPNHVFAFFDACFTGQTREGDMLIASAKNINIAVSDTARNNLTIFNSSDISEFSIDFDTANHGLFSYYLMKGLEGDADFNKDQSITTNELHTFIKENVSETAINLGRTQTPTLVTSQEKVIVTW